MVRNKVFRDEIVEVARDAFVRCVFVNCEIVGFGPTFIDCVFHETSNKAKDSKAARCVFHGCGNTVRLGRGTIG